MSSHFAKKLKNIRNNRGFKSARSFYQFLQKDRDLPFNYPYYARIEAGKVLPSAGIVSFLGTILSENESDQLSLAYCSTLFPQKEALFQSLHESVPVYEPVPQVQSLEELSPGQQFLSGRQLEAISTSKTHYHLFLALTLARRGLENHELKSIFASAKNLDLALMDLNGVKVIRSLGNLWGASIPDVRFPKSEDETTKQLYQRLDGWDRQFSSEFKFESLLEKSMIRRISGRYLTLLMSHCNLLFDAVRSSEEVTKVHNSEVLSLQLSLSHGRLPG